MSTVKVPVVIDEVDLDKLMIYFDADDPSHALSEALKWAAVAYENYAVGRFAAEPKWTDEGSHQPGSNDDFAGKSKTELQQIVAYTFPNHLQERIEELLDKKREGDITENEMRDLDQLLLLVQLNEL